MKKITFYSKQDWEKFRNEIEDQYPPNRCLDWQIGEPVHYPVVLVYEIWENSTYAVVSGIYISAGDLNTEPKFRKGDWITKGKGSQAHQVIEVVRDQYLLESPDSGKQYLIPARSVDSECHKWTIEDAQDPGDILWSGWENVRRRFLR